MYFATCLTRSEYTRWQNDHRNQCILTCNKFNSMVFMHCSANVHGRKEYSMDRGWKVSVLEDVETHPTKVQKTIANNV